MSKTKRVVRVTRESDTHQSLDTIKPVQEKAPVVMMKNKAGTQRLFRLGREQFVLLTKAGQAVAFEVDHQNRVHIRERLEGVDFKATGTLLKREGWQCVGPGFEYDWVLRPQQE